MSRRFIPLAIAALALPLASAQADENQPPDEAEQEPPTCRVTFSQRAYRTEQGYDHLVELDNSCDVPVRCSLTTPNADKDIVVDADTEASVTVEEDREASHFEVRVACEPKSDI